MPDIEKKSATSRIIYKTETLSDKQSSNIIELAAYILNKPYETLLDNSYKRKHFLGVDLNTGLRYSSLSMGSGEQRVIKILRTVQNAEQYSLILIDEIDLLLHVSALNRLIKKLHEISAKKNIQIVFTTHSIGMANLKDYVKIQYINNNGEGKDTSVYEEVTPDLILSMTGQKVKSHIIYVEDRLAAALVRELVRQKGKAVSVDVVQFGAVSNAFTLAASFVIQNESLENKLIVLDGDVCREKKDKEEQIKKKLTGTEEDSEEKRAKALSIITEFNLPENVSPEEFLFQMILQCIPHENEIYSIAAEINAVNDSHEWINRICNALDCDYNLIVREIFRYAYEGKNATLLSYLKQVEEWVDSHVR